MSCKKAERKRTSPCGQFLGPDVDPLFPIIFEGSKHFHQLNELLVALGAPLLELRLALFHGLEGAHDLPSTNFWAATTTS